MYTHDFGLKGCFIIVAIAAALGLPAIVFVLVVHVWPWLKTVLHAATA